jgi:hypothetical protein
MTMGSQRKFSGSMLRLPILLFVVIAAGVLVTTLPAATGDTIADHVVGQIDFVHSTANFVDDKGISLNAAAGAVAFDSLGHVYIADTANNRVLGFDILANLNDNSGAPAALLVFGQPDQYSNQQNAGGLHPSANTMWSPGGVATDSVGNLFVSDTTNQRILEFNSPFVANSESGSGDTIADNQIGQPNFTSNTPCSATVGTPGPGCFSAPEGIAVDSVNNLWVADTGNSRVLEFNAPINTSTGALVSPSAHFVLGQGVVGNSFTTALCNGGAASPNTATLCSPAAVAVDAGLNVYVSDTGNNRALEYDNPLATGVTCTPNPSDDSGCPGDAAADDVFGQGSTGAGTEFTTQFCDGDTNEDMILATTLCTPEGIGVDSVGNLYIADQFNNRVLEYNTPLNASSGETDAGNTTADLVFGQAGSFTSNNPGAPPTSSNFWGPG